MLNLSTCPQCKRMVTLPESGDDSVQVRCPLCSAEYPLRDALALVPPELIVLPVNGSIAAPATTPKPPTGLLTEPFFMQGAKIAPPADNSGVEVPAGEARVSESPDDFSLDFEEHLAEAETPSAEREEADDLVEIDPNKGSKSTVAPKPSIPRPLGNRASSERVKALPPITHLLKPPPRRKVAKKHPIRFLFGLIISAGVGLLIAYYGVWWIRGESAGFPRFDWLPFLPAEEHAGKVPGKPTPLVSDPNALPDERYSETDMQHPADSTSSLDKSDNVPELKHEAERKKDKITPPEEGAEKTPPPKPAEEIQPQIGPRSPVKFTAVDLDTAINDVTGALFGKNATGKVHEQSYPQLCRLAEVQSSIAPDKILPGQQQNVQDYLTGIAKDSKQFDEVGRLAAEMLKKAGDRQDGILMAGKASNVSSKNGLFGAAITLADGGDTVAVMSDKPLNFQNDDDVLLTGVMIPNPAKNLAGYVGSKPLVIWLGTAVRVTAP